MTIEERRAALPALYADPSISRQDIADRLGCSLSVLIREVGLLGLRRYQRHPPKPKAPARVESSERAARQAEAVRLWREGLDGNQIAGRLGISWHFVKRYLADEPREFCLCGCQLQASPGARWILGHSKRGREGDRELTAGEQYRRDEREKELARPLTTRCARCGFRHAGTVREAMAAFRAHPCAPH